MTTTPPKIPLPKRIQLARMFQGQIRYCHGSAVSIPKAELHTYVTLAEDTITVQARELSSDLDDVGAARTLRHENAHLRAQNASLRELLAEAVLAGATGDSEALAIIRGALEKTS